MPSLRGIRRKKRGYRNLFGALKIAVEYGNAELFELLLIRGLEAFFEKASHAAPVFVYQGEKKFFLVKPCEKFEDFCLIELDKELSVLYCESESVKSLGKPANGFIDAISNKCKLILNLAIVRDPLSHLIIRVLHHLIFDSQPSLRFLWLQSKVLAFASEKTSHPSLAEFWKSGKKFNWDRKIFAQKFLLALLTSPWIDQECLDLFFVEEKNGYHDLISQHHFFSFNPHYISKVECKRYSHHVLFCFDEMLEPIDPEVLEPFSNPRLCTVVVDLEKELARMEISSYEDVRNKTEESLIYKSIRNHLLPLLFEKLLQIRFFLYPKKNKKEGPTPFDILLHLYPLLALRIDFSLPFPKDRLSVTDRSGYTWDKNGVVQNMKRPPSENVNMKTIIDDFCIRGMVAEALLKKDEKPFRNLSFDYLREYVISCLNLSKLSSNVREFIFKNMAGYSFKSLDLSHCEINHKTLFSILESSPFLERLNLSHCKIKRDKISNILNKINNCCPFLIELTLSSYEESYSFEIEFRNLRYLYIDNCRAKYIKITNQNLIKISVKDCMDLKKLMIESPVLQQLHLEECRNLTEINCPNAFLIKEFIWKGCGNFIHAQLYEKFPFLIPYFLIISSFKGSFCESIEDSLCDLTAHFSKTDDKVELIRFVQRFFLTFIFSFEVPCHSVCSFFFNHPHHLKGRVLLDFVQFSYFHLNMNAFEMVEMLNAAAEMVNVTAMTNWSGGWIEKKVVTNRALRYRRLVVNIQHMILLNNAEDYSYEFKTWLKNLMVETAWMTNPEALVSVIYKIRSNRVLVDFLVKGNLFVRKELHKALTHSIDQVVIFTCQIMVEAAARRWRPPKETLLKLGEILTHANISCRLAACKVFEAVLQNERALTPEILQTLVALLDEIDLQIRKSVLRIFGVLMEQKWIPPVSFLQKLTKLPVLESQVFSIVAQAMKRGVEVDLSAFQFAISLAFFTKENWLLFIKVVKKNIQFRNLFKNYLNEVDPEFENDKFCDLFFKAFDHSGQIDATENARLLTLACHHYSVFIKTAGCMVIKQMLISGARYDCKDLLLCILKNEDPYLRELGIEIFLFAMKNHSLSAKSADEILGTIFKGLGEQKNTDKMGSKFFKLLSLKNNFDISNWQPSLELLNLAKDENLKKDIYSFLFQALDDGWNPTSDVIQECMKNNILTPRFVVLLFRRVWRPSTEVTIRLVEWLFHAETAFINLLLEDAEDIKIVFPVVLPKQIRGKLLTYLLLEENNEVWLKTWKIFQFLIEHGSSWMLTFADMENSSWEIPCFWVQLPRLFKIYEKRDMKKYAEICRKIAKILLALYENVETDAYHPCLKDLNDFFQVYKLENSSQFKTENMMKMGIELIPAQIMDRVWKTKNLEIQFAACRAMLCLLSPQDFFPFIEALMGKEKGTVENQEILNRLFNFSLTHLEDGGLEALSYSIARNPLLGSVQKFRPMLATSHLP